MAKEKKVVTEEKTVAKEKAPKVPQKLTYEQLEQLAAQYYSQNKAFAEKLKEAEQNLSEVVSQLEAYQKNEYWMRIDLLWRILTLEGNEELFSRDFVEQVSKEFTLRVFPPAQKEEK